MAGLFDDIHVPARDADSRTEKLIAKYEPRFLKKMAGKDEATKAIMANAFACAIYVLDALRDVKASDAVLSVFLYCKDEEYHFISKAIPHKCQMSSHFCTRR